MWAVETLEKALIETNKISLKKDYENIALPVEPHEPINLVPEKIDYLYIIKQLIKSPYQTLKAVYFFIKLLTIGESEMTREKLTTIIGTVIALLATILTIFGITLPPEISTSATPFLVAIILIIWKPNEKKPGE